jgi:hypothetical protein
MKILLHFSISATILLLAFSFSSKSFVFGHTFSGDESASFLAGVEMTKIESQLAEKELSNATIAKEHADHLTEHITANDTKEIKERNPRLATELNNSLTDLVNTIESESPIESEVKGKVSNITDILSEVVSARIDKEQLDNVTVKALVVNDLVGESLEHYASALGIEENGLEENQNKTSASHATGSENNVTANIADEADYQTAQAAASRAIELYNEIKPSEDSNSSQLADSLSSLKSKIDSKSSFDDIDKEVDEKVSPLLNEIFKLNLAEKEGHAAGEDHGQEEDHAESEEETHGSSESESHETESG